MNDNTIRLYDTFGKILSYPNEDYRLQITDCRLQIAEIESNQQSAIGNQFEKFIEETKNFSLSEFEELYTQTFDINPVASLELGWHLYGETYERGTFLVQMKSLMRKYFVEETTELPDHISQALAVLARMEQQEANEFASQYFFRALDIILEGFSEKKNPYEHILSALKLTLTHQH